MSIVTVLSVRDIVADTYGRPFFAPNVPSAVRSVRAEVNSAQGGTLNTNPDDFQLFDLGTFDDQTCRFQLYEQPVMVLNNLSALVERVTDAA